MAYLEKARGLWKATAYNDHYKRVLIGRFLTKEDAEDAEAKYYERRTTPRRRPKKQSTEEKV